MRPTTTTYATISRSSTRGRSSLSCAALSQSSAARTSIFTASIAIYFTLSLNGAPLRLPTSYVIEPPVTACRQNQSHHVLTRSAGALELVFFALDNSPPALVAYVCSKRGDDHDDLLVAPDDEFFNAATRLLSTHAGYRLIAVVAPGEEVRSSSYTPLRATQLLSYFRCRGDCGLAAP